MALIVLGACSFQPRAAVTGGGDDAAPVDGVRHDASIDARPIDARPLDAPPDACSDVDSDGTCDNVDDWPCGPDPTPPGSTVTMTGNNGATNMVLSNISVNGSQLVIVQPGGSLAAAFHYAVTDTACPSGCVDQIELGYVPGHRLRCVFDQTVSKQNGASGTASATLTAPLVADEYDLRTNIGQGNSCGTQTQWWANVPPDDTRTIARVCVH